MASLLRVVWTHVYKYVCGYHTWMGRSLMCGLCVCMYVYVCYVCMRIHMGACIPSMYKFKVGDTGSFLRGSCLYARMYV
jgi:hypothetical protein